ncbi:serine/threonine protein kinase [Leptolyngbya sp. FACHB-541]|nr:serine/threonine protein kinase [Leptolyngbya sp. FACHB-541]
MSNLNEILHGRYEIQKPLGKRAGRQTFLARDLQTQAQVVIKLLTLGKEFQWQDLKLFEREASILQTLSHPAIPRYLDYLDIDSPAYKGFALVQSYVEAKSLEEHLKAGRTFSEADVKQLAKALLEVLIYLHQQSPPVVHRDIKPSNILLTNRSGHSTGEAYLVDFGSVQTLAAKEGSTITVVGTYGYMPPEQFGGRAVPASDLYSLGATLIFLVTGQHPTELSQDDFRIHFRQAVTLDSTFADWLERLTEPSLDRRLASAEEALLALETAYLKPQIPDRSDLTFRSETTSYLPGSDIVVTKTPDFLEILIPPEGVGLKELSLLALNTPLWWFWLPQHQTYPGEFTLLVQFISIALSGLLAIALIRASFKKTRLRVSKESIFITHELFGWKRRRHLGAGKHKTNVEFDLVSTSSFFYSYPETELSKKPCLKIWVNNEKHLLLSGLLTEYEARWLIRELRTWLKVEPDKQ